MKNDRTNSAQVRNHRDKKRALQESSSLLLIWMLSRERDKNPCFSSELLRGNKRKFINFFSGYAYKNSFRYAKSYTKKVPKCTGQMDIRTMVRRFVLIFFFPFFQNKIRISINLFTEKQEESHFCRYKIQILHPFYKVRMGPSRDQLLSRKYYWAPGISKKSVLSESKDSDFEPSSW